MIGIISYLPQVDENLRNRRLKNHIIQLEWLAKVFPDEIFNVVAQGYTPQDIEAVSRFNINHYQFETGIGSHKSRNLLLKQFYESGDTWLLLLDDDVLLYDYYDADEFLHDVYCGKYDKYNFDIILPVMPEHTPFKELNLKNRIDTQYVLSKSPVNNCPNLMLMRSTIQDRYFDDTIDLKKEDAIPDDSKFIVDLVASGYKVNRADFMIKKSLDILQSVIYSTTERENKAEHALLVNNLKKYVHDRYKQDSLRKFNAVYGRADLIVIPRESVYDLPDNLLNIKHYSKTKKKRGGLFNGV